VAHPCPISPGIKMATQLTDFVSVIGLAFLWERGKGKGERGKGKGVIAPSVSYKA